MQLGDRINTKLGMATIVGFEDCNVQRSKCIVVSRPVDEYSRVLVALDDQTNWPWGKSVGQPHPFIMESDMLLPMCEARVKRRVTPAGSMPAPKPLPTIDPNLLDDIEMREHKHSVQMVWAFTLVMALVGLILVITTGHAK
jgi:hypothetical protein